MNPDTTLTSTMFVLTGVTPPSKPTKSASSIFGAALIIDTGDGGSSLKLRVSGIRKIRAASAVTAGSALSPFSPQNSLNRSAIGIQSATGTGSDKPQ